MKHNHIRLMENVKVLRFDKACPVVRSIIQKESKVPVPGTLIRVTGLGVETYALVDHNRNKIFLRYGDWIIEEIDGTVYVVSNEKFKEKYVKDKFELGQITCNELK